jgi:hypothetical protein
MCTPEAAGLACVDCTHPQLHDMNTYKEHSTNHLRLEALVVLKQHVQQPQLAKHAGRTSTTAAK